MTIKRQNNKIERQFNFFLNNMKKNPMYFKRHKNIQM
jgi:hypothetical protein